MYVARTIHDVREKIKENRCSPQMSGKGMVGFIPTMGFLHKGHLSLVKEARKVCSFIVMSIFVNKIQFNQASDFDTYPRDLERDLKLAEDAGIDLVFLPDDSEMYTNRLTTVNVEKITDHLCGAYRPGHFTGVFTVVSKLFNIVQPDIAVFGQKDIQQAISIEKMVTDLNFPLKIVIAPIVREDDGLALSSRNKHLSADERSRALVLFQGLTAVKKAVIKGNYSAKDLIKKINEIVILGNPDSIDYISVVDYETLEPVEKITDSTVIAVAAFFGETRLIDNMIIKMPVSGPEFYF